MRGLIVTLFSAGLFSCNSGNKAKPETSTGISEKKITPDFNVALNFINDYTKFCTKTDQRSTEAEWIKQNSMLTDNFKNRYKYLLDSAQKKDP
jgi:hypothetical protein